MLQFNSRGLLIPGTIIHSSLEEFEHEFVIKPDNEIRKELFIHYQQYCKALKVICGDIPLTQWINGSFTTKIKSPGDIDLVTFINAETIKKNESHLKELIYPQSVINYKLDGYMVVVYPENAKQHFLTKADFLYWMDHFGKTKPDRRRKRTAKGFLEIII